MNARLFDHDWVIFLGDDGSMDTIIVIKANGVKKEFRYDSETAAMFRNKKTGAMTAKGLKELASDAIESMDDSDWNDFWGEVIEKDGFTLKGTKESGYRVSCSQCQANTINGIATHEHGCPNSRKAQLQDDEDWTTDHDNPPDTYCVRCDKPGDTATMRKNPYGAGYLHVPCYMAWINSRGRATRKNPLTGKESRYLVDLAHADMMGAAASAKGSVTRHFNKGRVSGIASSIGAAAVPGDPAIVEALEIRGKTNALPNPCHSNPNWTSPEKIPLSELSLWVDNDEGLYKWWKGSRMSKQAFLKENRSEIAAAVHAAINRPPRGNPANRDVAKAFAAGATKGKGYGSVYIKGDTIYSYGPHFPIATWITPDIVAMTTRGYSVTTSKHKSYVRNALSMAGITVVESRGVANAKVTAPDAADLAEQEGATAKAALLASKREQRRLVKEKKRSLELRDAAGVSEKAWGNPKTKCPKCESLNAWKREKGSIIICPDCRHWSHSSPEGAIVEQRAKKPRESRILRAQHKLAMDYDAHLRREINKKRHENPARTLLGRKALEVKMTGGHCQGNFGACYGLADGSTFIKGLFTKVPGGRVQYISYMDEAKAKREGMNPPDRAWKHDFSSLDVVVVRCQGGVLLKSKNGTPLWGHR